MVVNLIGGKDKCDVDVGCLDEVCKIMSVSVKDVVYVTLCLPATFMGISSTWVL